MAGSTQLAIAFWIAATLCADAARAQSPACRAVETRDGALADIDERLEITLEDGSRLRLYGVESPPSSDGGQAAIDLRAALTDRELSVEFLASGLDRWGRRAARIVAAPSGDAEAMPVAEALVSQGAARVRVEPGPVGCLRDLLALEATAREAKAGLWANPANAAINARDRQAFAGKSGQTILVEGRVASVGETATRLYLNFGPIRTVDFAATIGKPTLRSLASLGIDPHALTGALLRVRGELDLRFGPQIEIVYPTALEIVAPAAVSP